MSTITASSYAEAVARALDDLPATTATELLEGLGEHLAEIGVNDFASLVDLLGPPEVYAAELRASAGLPARVVAPRSAPLLPPVSSGEDATRAPRPPMVRIGSRHIARFGLIVVAAAALVALIGSSDVIDPWAVVLIAVLAGAVIWAGRWLVRKSELPGSWVLAGTIAVSAVALAASAIAGAASRHDATVVFTDPGRMATTVLPFEAPKQIVALPDLRQFPVGQAIQIAEALGLSWEIQGDGSGSVVVSQDPAPGSLLAPGAVVLLTSGTPGSTDSAPPPVTTAASTTAAPPP